MRFESGKSAFVPPNFNRDRAWLLRSVAQARLAVPSRVSSS
jgi:hypothetical protein